MGTFHRGVCIYTLIHSYIHTYIYLHTEILVQTQSLWNTVGARPTTAPRNSTRNNAAGIMIVWCTSPPRILWIHSLHQVATGTPSHVPIGLREIIITTFQCFGTNCMVPSDWESALICCFGPNFMSDLIGESPIFWAASMKKWFVL